MRVAAIALVFLLSACESDVEKLRRLESEKTTQCLNEQYYMEKYTKARPPYPASSTPESDSLGKLVLDYKARCELLTRQYEAVGR